MPNIHAAIKRVRRDRKKQVTNQAALSELKSLRKKIDELVKSEPAKAKEAAQTLISKLDKAVSHGLIPHRQADRKKSRIGKLLSKIEK